MSTSPRCTKPASQLHRTSRSILDNLSFLISQICLFRTGWEVREDQKSKSPFRLFWTMSLFSTSWIFWFIIFGQFIATRHSLFCNFAIGVSNHSADSAPDCKHCGEPVSSAPGYSQACSRKTFCYTTSSPDCKYCKPVSEKTSGKYLKACSTNMLVTICPYTAPIEIGWRLHAWYDTTYYFLHVFWDLWHVNFVYKR